MPKRKVRDMRLLRTRLLLIGQVEPTKLQNGTYLWNPWKPEPKAAYVTCLLSFLVGFCLLSDAMSHCPITWISTETHLFSSPYIFGLMHNIHIIASHHSISLTISRISRAYDAGYDEPGV